MAILRRMFSRPAARMQPRSRLTPAQAAEIAARTVAGSRTAGLAVPTRAETGLVWDVCEVAYGSGWRVCVDDATGEPGPVRRWGVR